MSLLLLKDLENRTALALIAQAKAQKQEFTTELTELESIVFNDELQIALWNRIVKLNDFRFAHGHSQWLRDVLLTFLFEDGLIQSASDPYTGIVLSVCAKDEIFRRIEKLTDDEMRSIIFHQTETHETAGMAALSKIAASPVDVLLRVKANDKAPYPRFILRHTRSTSQDSILQRMYDRAKEARIGLSSCSFSDGNETWVPKQFTNAFIEKEDESVLQIEAMGRNIVKVSRYDENGDFVSSFTLRPSLPRTWLTSKEVKAYEHRFKWLGAEPEKSA